MFGAGKPPERIVCLTEEPTEILYGLGLESKIVGISAYTVRPPEAAERHPVVSAFIGGSVKKIRALEPDLVIGFSDIQAELARDLIKAHLPVLILNQRSVQQILDAIVTIGAVAGAQERAAAWSAELAARLQAARARGQERAARPRVYFEEWDDPLISAIEWVSELIEIAGGQSVFADRAAGKGAADRFVTHAEVIAADPQVIIASWCGKPVSIESIVERPGYDRIAAVRAGRVLEMDPSIILQPGPASLTDGLEALERAIGGGGA